MSSITPTIDMFHLSNWLSIYTEDKKYFFVKLSSCEDLMKFYVILVNCEILMQAVKRDSSLNKKLIK